MASRFRNYAATAALADDDLRQAAASGEPTDQVFACWRLMTRGQAIRTITELGPDPGIRRLLLLGLASTRELVLLAAIARSDPDPQTRLEALRWLMRVAGPSELPELLGPCLVAEVEDDVLSEVLGSTPVYVCDTLRPSWEALLTRSSAALRRVAADRLIDQGPGFPHALVQALCGEADLALREHWLARWAGSVDHEGLLEHTTTTRTLIEPALHALAAAARHYPFERLASLATDCPESALVRVLGPPWSDAARAWLLAQTWALLARGEDPEPLLDALHLAHVGHDLDALAARDQTLLQLLAPDGAPSHRAELEQLVGACSSRLSHLAAWRLVELDGALSPPVRWYALTEPDAALLAVWAGSDAHPELLDVALQVDGAGGLHPHPLVLAALAGAARIYPWPALARLAKAIEAQEDWHEGPEMIEALIALIARPWPMAARSWAVTLEEWLGHRALQRFKAALQDVPVDQRTPEELACLAGVKD